MFLGAICKFTVPDQTPFLFVGHVLIFNVETAIGLRIESGGNYTPAKEFFHIPWKASSFCRTRFRLRLRHFPFANKSRSSVVCIFIVSHCSAVFILSSLFHHRQRIPRLRGALWPHSSFLKTVDHPIGKAHTATKKAGQPKGAKKKDEMNAD